MENKSYGKRPLWQWLLLYAIVAIIVYGAFYYFVLAKKGGDSTTSNPYSNNQTVSPTEAMESSESSMEMMKINVSGSEFAFTPSTINVKKGQKVEITFKNTGDFPHNMTIEGVASSKTIQPGEEDTFSFTADKAGSYSYSCTVDSHTEKGMTGTLTVE